MRHALIAAVSLCVPAMFASADARPVIDNEGHTFVTIKLMGGHATDQGAQLQVRSLSWSPRSGGSNELKLDDSAGGASATGGRVTGIASDPPEPGARNGHSMLGASDKVSAGAQTESGQATGKRVHKPLRVRMYYDQPQGRGPGELVVEGSLPGCEVGKRYGGMQFAASGRRYELKDVVISNCPTSAAPKETITFVYGQVAY